MFANYVQLQVYKQMIESEQIEDFEKINNHKPSSAWVDIVSAIKMMNQLKRYDHSLELLSKLTDIQKLEGVKPDHRIQHLYAFTFSSVLNPKIRALSQLMLMVGNSSGFNAQLQQEIKKVRSLICSDCEKFIQILGKLDEVSYWEKNNYSGFIDILKYQKKLFSTKMKADYLRNQLKYGIGSVQLSKKEQEMITNIDSLYKEAQLIAEKVKGPFNETKLGLVLNYSVFLYEYKDNLKQALDKCKREYKICHDNLSDDEKTRNLAQGVQNNIKSMLNSMENNITQWQKLAEK